MIESTNVYNMVRQSLDVAQQSVEKQDYGSAIVALLSNIAVTLAHIHDKLDQPKVMTTVDKLGEDVLS